MRLAYIAQGKLSLITPEQPARRIESRFAQDMIDRAIRRAESKAWRAGGGSGMWGNANLWNVKQDFDPAAVDRKSTRLNSSHSRASRMPSSA